MKCSCVPVQGIHLLHATARARVRRRQHASNPRSRQAGGGAQAHRRTYSMATRTVASALPSSTTITSYVNVGPFLSRLLCRYLQPGQQLSRRRPSHTKGMNLNSHITLMHSRAPLLLRRPWRVPARKCLRLSQQLARFVSFASAIPIQGRLPKQQLRGSTRSPAVDLCAPRGGPGAGRTAGPRPGPPAGAPPR